MMSRIFLTCLLTLGGGSLTAGAVDYLDWVEWDKIEHWAGDPAGEKKSALVVDFQDGKSNRALVWGYRWNGTATGEDLVRAVASQSSILTAMIQYTGTMGSTLNALGVSDSRVELEHLGYDFSAASVSPYISYGFFEPNRTMGQEAAPGYQAEGMCAEAIERAKDSGIIEHPLNAFVYGYPAYDYDYWQLDSSASTNEAYRWKSGWYEGYWSYWHGPNDYDYLGYSGLGMSSTQLVDGGVQAWKYTPLNGGEGFGFTGGELAFELDYAMEEWNEEMHEATPSISIISHDDIANWVGEGEKAAAVVIHFDDGREPANLIYGYRWSGGWDDTLDTALDNIAEADPQLQIVREEENLLLGYGSSSVSLAKSAGTRHELSDDWKFNVKRVVDSGFNIVPSGRWLNPNAVLVVSHNEVKDLDDIFKDPQDKPTGIGSILHKTGCRLDNGKLIVEGHEGETLKVISLSGITMKEVKVVSAFETYSLDIPRGSYVITIGGKSITKVML